MDYKSFQHKLHIKFSIYNKPPFLLLSHSVDYTCQLCLRQEEIIQTHFKNPVRYLYAPIPVRNIAEHRCQFYVFRVRIVCHLSALEQNRLQHLFHVRVFIHLPYQAVKKGHSFPQHPFHSFANPLPGPCASGILVLPFLRQILIHYLTDRGNQVRISRCIAIDFLCHCRHVHSGISVLLILCQHTRYLLPGERHFNPEPGRNIPRTIVLMRFIRSQLQFQILNVINPCQNYRMKNRADVPGKIISPKLRKEIDEYLIVAGAVHFINHQYHRTGGLPAHFT